MSDVREVWQPGESAWFEYHCWESPESHDAPAWYHSHQRVIVLDMEVNDGEGFTRAERDEEGVPFTYGVRFPDGLEWCAFGDELSDTQDEWDRPDPPKQA